MVTGERRRPTDIFNTNEVNLILCLRLLIARAANKDSLAWWDDESLTVAGGFVLERLFPVAPPLAGRGLALRTALTRHEAAFAVNPKALHLYRLDLDNRDKLALRFEPLWPISVPSDPITTMDALRRQLLDLLDEPPVYTVVRRSEIHGLHLEIPPPPPGVSLLVRRAQVLAWAYLEGAPEQPVFPFCQEAEKPAAWNVKRGA